MRWRFAVLFATWPAACATPYSLAPIAEGVEVDGGVDAPALIEASLVEGSSEASAFACSPEAPFTDPRLLLDTNDDELGGVLFGSDVFYTALTSAGGDAGQRSQLLTLTLTDAGIPSPISVVNVSVQAADPVDVRYASLRNNGLEIYYLARHAGLDYLYRGQRGNPMSRDFTGGLVTSTPMAAAYATDTTLFFSSVAGPTEAGTKPSEIYESTIADGAPSPGAVHSELTQPGALTHSAVATNAATRIYFASTRATIETQGGLDIWTASRPGPTGTFGELKVVRELSSDSDEVPTWVSADGCKIVLARKDGSGHHRLYVAEK